MKHLSYLLLLSIIVVMTSCSDSNDDTSNEPVYKAKFMLVDSSGNFQEVNIDIQDIQYNIKEDSLGWTSFMSLPKGIYNLLEFTGGKDTLLGAIESKSIVKQMRLVLGSNNTIMIDSMTYSLKVPSGQKSGIKLILDTNLVQGIEYTFWLDFNVEKSIVKTGNGKYILKPVIKVTSKAESGSIYGVITPAMAGHFVAAYNTTDTFQTYSNTNGEFLLLGVTQGQYSVNISPLGTYPDTTIMNVGVTTGQQTDLDTISF